MAKEYIERENYCNSVCKCDKEYCDKTRCNIWRAPAVDVAEVRHGRWIPYEVEERFENIGNPYHNYLKYEPLSYRCSLCGRIEEHKEPYCNCGAKMDGKNGAENEID